MKDLIKLMLYHHFYSQKQIKIKAVYYKSFYTKFLYSENKNILLNNNQNKPINNYNNKLNHI